ncbi:phage major capsid protein [Carnobacterium antarcticum]|uniref:Phage major capsid protein n=1 Tax=Carnobacterium antarcticum TaxID=2126436 RepID=A0ABW4NLQ4_9LACT|nr:phage major capsid protein [Carnobacterium sp. CP1]ALV21056.1 Phage capsid protein [Carnobacterium sp. CP1]
MFNEKVEALKANIKELSATINTQKGEITAKLNAEDLEGAKNIKDLREENKAKLETEKATLATYEAALEPDGVSNESDGTKKVVGDPTDEYRNAINNFIRTKGYDVNGLKMEGKDEAIVPYSVIKNEITPTTDGIVKQDTKLVTSDDTSYIPSHEVNTVVDLKRFTRLIPAKKGKGSYPVLKSATTKMISVAELEKNPKLAKPEFDNVDWTVLTYRGAIPLSQESIDDADVDLISLVNENVNEIKLNTTNSAVATVMKTFTAKNISDLDDLKAIQNVELDPAYVISYVVSQSFYQFLDTVKDGNGRYLLQDSIISPTGKVFSGHPIFVIKDEEFGAAGDSKAWVGDMKRAILFADRKNLGLRWADNEIYGQYLQAVTRFDVKVADKKAGFFLTYTAPVGE